MRKTQMTLKSRIFRLVPFALITAAGGIAKAQPIEPVVIWLVPDDSFGVGQKAYAGKISNDGRFVGGPTLRMGTPGTPGLEGCSAWPNPTVWTPGPGTYNGAPSTSSFVYLDYTGSIDWIGPLGNVRGSEIVGTTATGYPYTEAGELPETACLPTSVCSSATSGLPDDVELINIPQCPSSQRPSCVQVYSGYAGLRSRVMTS
jgi:hypothetical protein